MTDISVPVPSDIADNVAAISTLYDSQLQQVATLTTELGAANQATATATAQVTTLQAEVVSLQAQLAADATQLSADTAEITTLEAEIPSTVFPAVGAIASIYDPGNTIPTVQEAAIGREVAVLLYEGFGSWNGSLSAVGDRPVRIALSTRSSTPTYAQILSGSSDAWLTKIANLLKVSKNKILIDINAEADNSTAAPNPGTGANSAMFAAVGTPQQLAQVVAHCKAVFHAAGCTAPLWGMDFCGDQPASYYTEFWAPGVYDWVGYDPYTKSAAKWTTPSQLWASFYNLLQASSFKGLPIVIGETGAISDPRRVAWLENVPAALTVLPLIKWWTYWSDKANYDFTLTAAEYPALKVAVA